ncbi:MAG: response regulator transcription factor [Chloroflexota bacterium]|nr:MAG: response regulator transcription factor [Chloroflexota bacterium]
MKTILVVDDEPKIVQLARDYLEHAGYAVVTAGDGRAALEAIGATAPDLVVLDLGLPEIDGLEVTRRLRRDGEIPILMLTARDDEIDKLLGLELGADDYMTKPFSPRELVARVRAILRRTDQAGASGAGASGAAGTAGGPRATADSGGLVLRAGEVSIDVDRMRVEVAGRDVELTPTEFQLLVALVRRPGRILTRSQLLDAVHGVAFDSYERAIDTHVKNLRRKLEPDPRLPRFVLTVHGVGYRFADDRDA